jgi:outer membrane protein assembly factor BamD (BamD/ComL family)
VAVIYSEYLKDDDKGFAAYQELLAHYPGTRQAVDALYEVGAYYLKNRKFPQAVQAYQQFIYNYPNDGRVEDAMIAIAQAHMEQKAYDKALDAYQSYLAKFPQGQHAAQANAQVAWIRTYYY